MDSATAATLAQILPLLLIALLVELRRTELHHRGPSRRRTVALLATFFIVFGIIETVLVLSIDGEFVPFKWSDLAAALIIFGLLAVLFVLSLMSSASGPRNGRGRDGTDSRPDRFEEDDE
jgi:DMSO/TMAO reductase YedYZ heme-binding membrane subunit